MDTKNNTCASRTARRCVVKNGKPNDWESRLTRLEDDVRLIKVMLVERSSKRGWKSVVGSLGGDPVFAEIHRITMDLIEKDRERDKKRLQRRAARTRK